jgi:hypothetical protein
VEDPKDDPMAQLAEGEVKGAKSETQKEKEDRICDICVSLSGQNQ